MNGARLLGQASGPVSGEISESFETVATKVRRGEKLTESDVRQLRLALATAEYHLDDVLEPLANGDDLRDDVAILEGCGR